MGINSLLLYLLQVVREGHRWQHKDMNGVENPPRFYFSLLQWIALFYAISFTVIKRDGFSDEAIDYTLSALSIMAGLFLGLIVLVLDKSDHTTFTAENGNEQIRKQKLWNFYYQFVSLTSYAILIALLEICLLIGTIIFGSKTDLGSYGLVLTPITAHSVLLFFKLSFVVLIRICSIYFLIDFILLSVFAVSCIFQIVKMSMEDKNPHLVITISESFETAIRRENLPYKKTVLIFWLIVVLSAIFIFMR